MMYRVDLADRAVRDLELLFLEKNAVDSPAAARWFNRLEQAVCVDAFGQAHGVIGCHPTLPLTAIPCFGHG